MGAEPRHGGRRDGQSRLLADRVGCPVITANERFAILFPEKRPFFLEGVTLFTTPVQAVYTRTLTAPSGGLRATGGFGSTRYTVLAVEDRGGGSVIIPGPTGSEFAEQDFASDVLLGRVRHDVGDSFVSLLFADREIDGGGFNRVIGPDFEWRPTPQDTVTGQLLFSRSDTPERPDLAAEWDGRELSGHAGELWWYRQTATWDYFGLYEERSDGFRADTGFVPQVGLPRGLRRAGADLAPARPAGLAPAGVHHRPSQGGLRRRAARAAGQPGRRRRRAVELLRPPRAPLARGAERRASSSRPCSSSRRSRCAPARCSPRSRSTASGATRWTSPTSRPGRGWTATLTADVRPTDHLQLALSASRRVLDVDDPATGARGRLFTADVARLRAVYMFNARAWVRLIGEWAGDERDPALWSEPVDPKSADFAGSALFAYKLNWQTVLFLGYGDNRAFDDADHLQPASRELFFKLSYAFQG